MEEDATRSWDSGSTAIAMWPTTEAHTMLRQVVISLVASVLLGVTLGGLISNSGEAGVEKTQAKSAATAKRRGSSLPVVALVYAQRTDEGRRAEVRWQRLRWLNSSLLYTARPSRWSLHSVPDELGFLP